MTNKEYSYPDSDDKIVNVLIKDKESNKSKKYWEEDEKSVLCLMEKYIKNLKSEKLSLLDAGSGGGRLSVYFESLFKHVNLVEPDKKRLEKSKGLNINKFNYNNCKIESINFDNEFDVILCSHVIQHVNTFNLLTIFKKFRKAIRKNGFLFITTCYSDKPKDYFKKMYLEDSKLLEYRINKGKFNDLINTSNILPEHFFTIKTLKNLLNASDFRLLEFKIFHNKRDVFIAATI